MKQSFLFRLLVVVVFCMASLAIKSETSSCKATCYCTNGNVQKKQPAVLNDKPSNPNDKSEIFFIKI